MKKMQLIDLKRVTGGKVSILSLASSFCIGATLMYAYQQTQMPTNIYRHWHEMRGPAKKTIKLGDTTIKLYDLN